MVGNMDNRKIRRAKQSAFRRQLKTAKFDEFTSKTFEVMESGKFKDFKWKFVGFYVNSLYSLQVFTHSSFKFVGIRRHDQKPSCPWNHKQQIKDFVFGKHASAIEVFPSDSDFVDAASMYWLWKGQDITDISNEITKVFKG